MGKADLHAHTCHDSWGDGNQDVAALFRHVEENTDLDLFAITDHDSTDAARAAWELHRSGAYRFGFLPGVEVTNRAGHLLCYFPSGEIADIPSFRPFWRTVRFAHDHGAICVVAHPVYPPWACRIITRGLERGNRLEAIEAINAGLGEGAQQRLATIATALPGSDLAGHAVARVGNSDAHDASSVGAAYTEFPGRTVEDFVRALAAGETRPVGVRRATLHGAERRFTTRRAMTRPGWMRNLWREVTR